MNKTELARKIQALDGLSNEEKTALLELIRGHKKYGLVWEEKPEDIEERLREDLPVLVERNDDKVHPIISDNPRRSQPSHNRGRQPRRAHRAILHSRGQG